MKISVGSLIVLVIISSSVSVYAELEPFNGEAGFCGFKNTLGKVVVPAKKYSYCGELNEGLAYIAVYGNSSNDKYRLYQGFVDNKGDIVIPTEHLVGAGVRGFSDGLVAVYKPYKPIKAIEYFSENEGYFGYMDKKRELVIPYKYTYADNFVKGFAVVGTKNILSEELKYGVIDKNDRILVPIQYDYVSSYDDGMFMYGEKNHWNNETIFGFIDSEGKVKIKAQWNELSHFSEGLAVARIGSVGFINKDGEYVIKPKYSYAYPFSEGLAVVKIDSGKDGKWGVINKAGSYVVSPKYDYVVPGIRSESLIDNGYSGDIKYKNGKVEFFSLIDKSRGEKGKLMRYTVDSNGQVINKKIFSSIDSYYE